MNWWTSSYQKSRSINIVPLVASLQAAKEICVMHVALPSTFFRHSIFFALVESSSNRHSIESAGHRFKTTCSD